MRKFIFSFLILALAATFLNAQQEVFIRKAIIDPPQSENSGFGNAVVGVDFDGDGKKEIYFVNSNWNDTGAELIPRIYKFEQNATGGWDSVWAATMDIPLQNTWPALTYSDWDGDGKMELIWSPVNFTDASTNPNPARIIVFEQGVGDVLGIADGTGNYLPNAKWTITTTAMANLRPFRSEMYDINGDGKKELIYVSRNGQAGIVGNRFGVVTVSDIPDNGGGTETWTMLADDSAGVVNSSTLYDFAILDSTIYLLHSNGSMTPVYYANGTFTIGTNRVNVVPGGSWKSAMTVDIDGNGTKEIIAAGWSVGSNNVYILQKSGDSLTTTPIADFDDLAGEASQLYGGAYGDIDNDGKLDFVFGTRSSTPDAAILRLKYLGGDITNPASYEKQLIDKEYPIAAGRWDILAIANLDSEVGGEILYSSGVGSMAPAVILKRIALDVETIAAVKIDANGDYIPDRLGDTVSVMGIVNSVNFTASANRFSYNIQDETGGINITKGSETGGGPVYQIGDRLFAHGKLGQYRGTVQLELFDLAADVIHLDGGNAITPIDLSIAQYLANPENYESRYIKVNGVAKHPTSAAWPSGAAANMTIWDGFNTLVLRIDDDTDVDNNPEPTWPVNITGVGTQYTSSSSVYNDGYQITPSFYADIAQNVPAPPSPYFFLLEPANNARVIISDSAQQFTARWNKAIDFNGDAIIYQFMLLKTPVYTSGVLNDTTFTFTALQALNWLAGQDSLVTKWTVRAKGSEASLVSSVDTFNVTLVNDIVSSVNDNFVPDRFYVDQNYPNPFNPVTTIRFGLPSEASVDLRVYNILGQEVAVLINNEMKTAGNYDVSFNAKGLASGTYIYRLTSGSNVVTKKMVIMK